MNRLALAASAGLLVALHAATAAADPLQHVSLAANPPTATLPRKIVFLPPDVTVYTVAAGGVTERSEDRTAEVVNEVTTAVHDVLGNDKSVQLVALPALDDSARGRLDEHIALYEQVATAALRYGTWPNKIERFDYTLGNGLRFLKERSGAEAAVIVFTQSSVPTVSSYLANLPWLVLGVVVLPQAHALAIAGVVDLETGNVLWLNRGFSQGGSANAVEVALRSYPAFAIADKK